MLTVKSDSKHSSSVMVVNSSFVSGTNGVMIQGNLKVNFQDVIFKNINITALKIVPRWHDYANNTGTSLEVSLRNCFFLQNNVSLEVSPSIYGYKPINLTVSIEDTEFNGYRSPSTYFPGIMLAGPTGVYSSHQINLKNVTIISFRSRGAFSAIYTQNGSYSINIENSLFLDNDNLKDYIGKGAIAHILLPQYELSFSGCFETPQNKTKRQRYRTWNYRNQVHFQNTRFLHNTGYAAVVYLQNGQSRFMNCSFENNNVDGTGGVLFKGAGDGSLHIEDTQFRQTKRYTRARMKNRICFIYSHSAGPLKIKHSSFKTDDAQNFYPTFHIISGGYVECDRSTLMECPIGSVMRFNNLSHLAYSIFHDKPCTTRTTNLKLSCEACPPGSYSLERGTSDGLHVNQHLCQDCPYGATCIHNVTAKPNFWGHVSYKSSTRALTFLPCPSEYCQPPTSDTYYLNGCYGNRTGVLCGACARGYSEGLFTTECRENTSCQDNWFWILTLSYTMGFALFLVFKPPVVPFLWRQAIWFRSNPEDQRQETLFNPGYLKIVFYFYQIVELLLITSPEDLSHRVPFLPLLIGLFNFQVRRLAPNVGCPFSGLTVVTKQLFLSMKVFAILASTFIIYVIHRVVSKTRRVQCPSTTFYLAIAMEIMLLGYERLAETSMSLLHCVPIGSEWRLFLDGNIHCWQWWQVVSFVYMTVFVTPFIMVLYFGSLQLYRNRLSVQEFMAACVLPLPFLVYWVVIYAKKRGRRDTQYSDACAAEVKEILHEPFRQPTQGDKGAVYWESILIGRRFVLMCLHAFIADPLVRLLCMEGACVVILVHHLVARPYRSATANTSETMALSALVVIATFNVAKSAFASGGIKVSGPNETHFQVMQWIEFALLAVLPAAFGVLLLFSFLSQMIRLAVLAFKGLKRVFRRIFLVCEENPFSPEEQCQALLNPTIGN